MDSVAHLSIFHDTQKGVHVEGVDQDDDATHFFYQ